jgi:hypothetical protein
MPGVAGALLLACQSLPPETAARMRVSLLPPGARLADGVNTALSWRQESMFAPLAREAPTDLLAGREHRASC